MSKLFKELNYDTDLVMQPGDGDSIAYATCSTASGTAAKAATVQGKTGFTLSQGATVCVKFTAASTDDVPTLNVDSTGAKPIYYNGSAVSASSPFRWSANTVVTFVYDGTAWNAVGVQTNYYATCATAAATQEKTVVVEGGVGFVMTAGTKITVRFTESSTYVGQITANVNGTGALAIRLNRATVNSTTNPLFLTTGSTVTLGLYAGSTLYWEVMDHKRTEYAPCSTTASTAAKTVTAIARGIVLAQGSRFVVRFTYGNTVASPTLTLPGLSAYPICDSKGNALSADGVENWEADDLVVFVFLYNTGKSEFQYQIENSYMAKKLASSINTQVNTAIGTANDNFSSISSWITGDTTFSSQDLTFTPNTSSNISVNTAFTGTVILGRFLLVTGQLKVTATKNANVDVSAGTFTLPSGYSFTHAVCVGIPNRSGTAMINAGGALTLRFWNAQSANETYNIRVVVPLGSTASTPVINTIATLT